VKSELAGERFFLSYCSSRPRTKFELPRNSLPVSQELELGRFFLLTGYVVSACADQGLAGAGETRRGLRHDRARAGT
jgi:hypothetical protein